MKQPIINALKQNYTGTISNYEPLKCYNCLNRECDIIKNSIGGCATETNLRCGAGGFPINDHETCLIHTGKIKKALK